MRVKLNVTTYRGGDYHAPGTFLNLPEADAEALIKSNAAEAAPDSLDDFIAYAKEHDVELTTSDPAIRRAARAAKVHAHAPKK